MAKYFSNLKSIYKKTYDELKNPKSPIGIFLAKIDDYEFLDNAKEIKVAVTDYIKTFEEEEKNFQEPEISEIRVSYKGEQKRLRKNLEVEKKLADAVQKMQDALDIFAEARLKPRESYTFEQIKAMKNRKEQLKAQRERILNAAYSLEVDLENKMIEKLKAEYKAFDHRPMESKVELPPYVYDSPHYRIRHIELKGNLKVPTALYGMMRFRDLLNDHESMIEEAERSRQYEKFVKDRLAGFQAWKNTLKIEQNIYNEISSSVDAKYFEKYNKFMDQYAGTSCIAGYQSWYAKTYKQIQKMEEEIKEYEKEQKQLDEAFIQLEEDWKQLEAEDEIERINIEEEIKKAEDDPLLSPIFYENNENIKNQAEHVLRELEEELENKDTEMNVLNEEQDAARKTMLENVQRIQNYSNELHRLQEGMKNDVGKALQSFLKNHEEGAKQLDEILHESLEEIRAMAQNIGTHNENIEKAEKEIASYQQKVNELRIELDEITKAYEAAKEKATKDLKEQKTIGKRLVRVFNLGGKREESQVELEAAENQKDMIEAYEKNIKMLQFNVETNEKALLEEQDKLENYRLGWKNIHEELKDKIKKSYEYTTDLQVRLSQLESEKEKVTLEYEKKAEEIQKDVEEQKQIFGNILEKTSSEFDKLNAKKIMKGIERKQILDKMKDAEKKIEECKNNSMNIENAKAKKEELLKLREEFKIKKEERRADLSKDIEHARYRCAYAKTQLAQKRADCDTLIESHERLKKFYKEGKVTSNRVLQDLSVALSETMNIADKESNKQLKYIISKEDKLMKNYVKRMKDSKWFAERMVSQDVDKEEEKDTQVKAGVYDYMKQLSSMKKSNSKSFENLRKAVMKQYSENGEFLLEQKVTDAAKGIKRDDNLKEVKENLKQIADSAKAYIREKGSANRFTNVGKERYRFADEMRTMAETMLNKFELMEKEKEMANQLMKMDDSELYVSKQLSFYKTESYNMTRKAFVQDDEMDKMNMMNLGKELAGEKTEEIKEEQALEESGGREM